MFNKLPDWLSGCVIVPSGYRVSAKLGEEKRGGEGRGGKSTEEERRLDLHILECYGKQRNDASYNLQAAL